MLETDLIAITIALAGACLVMVLSIREQGRLTRENQRLKKVIRQMITEKTQERG